MEGSTYRNIYTNRYHDTTKRFQGFVKLFMVWKGSVIKLIWHDLLVFIVGYFTVSLLYQHVFLYHEAVAQYFEMICIYCEKGSVMIRTLLIFLIGFYVTQVVSRYWDQFMSLPWPDRIAFKLVSNIPGTSRYHRTLRRTVMRYVNLSTVLVLRLVAAKVHARFPTYDSLVKANLLLPHEKSRLQTVDERTPHETTYIPILWALNLLQNARIDGKITVEAPVYANLISAFDYLEDRNRKIFNHGWVNFPLAYTQVATLSVMAYFFACLFGRQYLVPREGVNPIVEFDALNITFSVTEPYSSHSPNMYIPFFTILEFISFVGWTKVAETLLNPFGDDDEDFQINYLIDRNFQVSYLIVDEAMTDLEMLNDPFLGENMSGIPPAELPYRNDEDFHNNCVKNIKFRGYKILAKVPCLRKYTGTLQYRRAYRCQSTRSRLRSLNENKGAKLIYPKRSQSTKRVHRASEISVIEDEYINLKSSMKKRPQTLRSMSTKSNNINFNDTVSIKSYHV